MATVRAKKREQRMVLHGVDWQTYAKASIALGDRHCVRLTFFRGCLEIMTISPEHERLKHLLGLIVAALSEEMRIVIAGFGSMTFARRPKRGLEPDQCYWIANEPSVHGTDDIDQHTIPPPDLVLEIDISRKSTRRIKVYANMGVPEVWRFDGQVLTFLTLGPTKQYAAAAASQSFPGLKPDSVTQFLALRLLTDEIDLIRQFRVWVRQNLAGGSAGAP